MFNWPQGSHVISNHGNTQSKIFLESSIIAFISFRNIPLKEKKSYSPKNSVQKFLCLSRPHGICWPLRLKKKNQHDKAAITFGKSYPQVCCSVFKSNVASLSVPQPRSQGHSSYERAWERGCQYLWYMYSLAAGKNGLLSKLANLYVIYMQVFGRR